MKLKVLLILLFIGCIACNNSRVEYFPDMKTKPESEMEFDKEKWLIKEGKDYLYRDKMLNGIVYNDTVRSLKKEEILSLFGEPSFVRNNDDFLYYMITQKRLFVWPLHTKTMVIKFLDENTIEWIKIHE